MSSIDSGRIPEPKIEIKAELYSVRGAKLYIGDKACVVRQGGKIIDDTATLQGIADLFNSTLKDAPTIKKNQVWKLSAQGVQVFERGISGKLKSAPKKELSFIDDSARNQYKAFVANTAKVDIVGARILQTQKNTPETLSKLNAVSNGRYNPTMLAQRLLLTYGDPKKIVAAIRSLQETDIRFNGKSELFSVDATEFATLIDHLVSVTTQSSGQVDTVDPKLTDQIATQLVGLVKRAPVLAPGDLSLCQISGHIDDEKSFTADGKAVSSLLQKSESNVSEIANHAVIKCGDAVVMSRSARTDTAAKILDKSAADIQARLETTSEEGLVKVGDHYEYSRVDISLMDADFIKASATTMRSAVKNLKALVKGQKTSPVESERAFLNNKKKAIKEIWHSKDSKVDADTNRRYIERTINGQKIREYEPLVCNFVFSGQANKPKNVKNARLGNIEPAIVLFRAIVQKEGLDRYAEALALSPTKRNEVLVGLIMKDLQDETISNELKIPLRALLVTLTGKDEKQKNYDTAEGSGKQFLLFHALSRQAKVAESAECKSGNDRSLTAVGLLCSAKEWEVAHEGKYYDPTTENTSDFAEFSASFAKYASIFGPQNLLAARGPGKDGKPDLKTGKSPVFMRYAGDNLPALQKTFNILGLKKQEE